jgi:hypothetical protein
LCFLLKMFVIAGSELACMLGIGKAHCDTVESKLRRAEMASSPFDCFLFPVLCEW